MKKMNKQAWPLVLALVFSVHLFGQNQQETNLSKVPGTVIKHQPASSGLFVGAPSIAKMSNGDYVVSFNFSSIESGDRGKVHRTSIYRSIDQGASWEFLTEIDNQRWSTIFYYRGDLYLIGVDKAFGNAIIRKSIDGGKTWTEPKDKKTGLLAEGRYHCAPVPVIIHNGRIWKAMEDAPRDRQFRAFMMSAHVEADLMDADNWTFSNKIPYNKDWYQGMMRGWLEGNAVITSDNKIANVLRCAFSTGIHGTAAIINISDDGQEASFDPDKGFINFPGASKKFTIRYDSETKKYWSLVNFIQPGDLKYLKEYKAGKIRNTIALASSTNLLDWIIERTILYHPDIEKHAFQYLDWLFDGNDLIAVSRTAYDDGLGGAHNYHDANFITFHRIEDFRNNFY
ncbi:MAG: exo-alpha-sialidase [Bacteroidales bacterium]|nr:exo-alpha-sialidase [Bacteroidales bacterium]